MNKLLSDIGIISCGSFLPTQRENIHDFDSSVLQEVAISLGVHNRSVKSESEDTVTLGVNATLTALSRNNLDLDSYKSLYLGTETPTYAVGNNAAAIANFIGLPSSNLRTATLEFACRAGTLAFIQAAHECIIYDTAAIAIGADKAEGAPDDILSYTAGIGGASFALGGKKHKADWIADVKYFSSYTDRVSDFWRAKDEEFPRHASRYSGEMYEKTTTACIEQFLAETGKKIADFDHIILHQPNAKLPQKICKKFGITREQIEHGNIFSETGNLYAGMVLAGLVNVLENAKEKQSILCVSYGSGAGSDAMWLQTTDKIERVQTDEFSLQKQIKNRSYSSINK